MDKRESKRKSVLGLLTNPLMDQKVIEKLVMLEEEIYMKSCSLLTITELTKIYSDLIEFYDNKKDPISGYFLEKIQILLSNKNTSKILDVVQTEKDQEKYQRRSQISINTKKELRAKMAEFNSKVNKMDDSEKKQAISEMLEQHQKQYTELNEHIKKETANQESEFNRKMSKRRQRSINRSLSRSMEQKQKNKKEKNVNTKNLLKHLDKKKNVENPFEK